MFVGVVTQLCYSCLPNPQGDEETFLLDSGATCHIVKKTCHMEGLTAINHTLIVGNNKSMISKQKGTIKILLQDNVLVLHNVLVIPEMATNIVSLGKLIDEGNSISMTAEALTISNSDTGNKLNVQREIDKNQG